MENLSHNDLKSLLDYDANTGLLTWKTRSSYWFNETSSQSKEQSAAAWNSRYAGKPALNNINKDGYRQGSILNKGYLAHRIVWFYMTGEWPKNKIDHKNNCRSDNKWTNLREATNSQNGSNSIISKNNLSGYKGVYWNKKDKRWFSQITHNRKTINLGRFKNKEDAAIAYNFAAIEMFGEFALINKGL